MTGVSSRPEPPSRLLRRLWRHLPAKRKVQLAALLATMVAAAAAEIVSLAAVVPFLTVLADPDRLWKQPWVRGVAERWGAAEPAELLLPLTLLFAASAVAAGIVRIVNLWVSGRVAAGTGSDLAQEAYCRTLHQPYLVHVARNSATITTAVISHIDGVVHAILTPALLIATNVIVMTAIATGLVFVDPWVAFLTVAAFGGAYLLISGATKHSLAANGHEQVARVHALMQNVQEGIGAIRDVLLDHSQPYYLSRYRDADWALRQLRARAELLGAFPRFVIEAGAMAGVAVLTYTLVTRQGGIAAALPVLGALALGAQRLLPALQQTYQSLTHLENNTTSLAIVLDLLEQPVSQAAGSTIAPASFTQSIALEHVSFRYQADMAPVFRDVSLTIRRGERVAFVGPTGSGKSTLADIIMGLLPPWSGRLLVDGREVAPEAWQANIAHVPQSIFLADASIAENIALGIPPAQVDRARLEAAARQAQIADFIESLPLGYDTTVGERGIRLSGGQRQRIGIARALYKKAPVLVFDEATSALDDVTEKSLMDTLDGLSRELTIIMIAHRTSTTYYCDRSVLVSGGVLREVEPSTHTALPSAAPADIRAG
jgi:ABC-type multidrug transport system fused ATPase/permease subunit